MRRSLPLLLPLLLLPPALAFPSMADAASFPCAKASSPTEKAICAEPALSRLDERVAAAYRDGMKRLSGGGPDSAASAAVKADQRAWLAERDACGADIACLRGALDRRRMVLGFAPDPGAPGAADRFVGLFDHGGFIEIAAMALRDGRIALSVSGAEPTSGRWVCDFSGIGQVDGGGRLVVGTPDAEGGGLILEAAGTGVTVPENDANLAASRNWCGHNGSFVWEYKRTSR